VGERPFEDPKYTNGLLAFYPASSGKTFRIVQSGVYGSPATKNGTAIIPVIQVRQNVKNLTLILDDIDLGVYANNRLIIGYIAINAGSDVTILLGNDTQNPGIGSSYVRGSISVPSGSVLSIDSASAPGTGSSAGALNVTARISDSAAIGSFIAGEDSGIINIKGGTVTATQKSNNATGAVIGGGGSTLSNTPGGSGSVNISGGTVVAENSGRGAAIGGGGISAYNAVAGDGFVTISGGTVVATNTGYGAAIGGGASLYSDNVNAGSNARSGGGKISVTGGQVLALGNKGAAIGGGQAGYGASVKSRTIDIGASASFKAYSSGVATVSGPLSANARPAIDASDIIGAGFFVNAQLNKVIANGISAKLDVCQGAGGPAINTLNLPANYRCFAYNTGASRTDIIAVYSELDSSLLGVLVHDDTDSSADIFSINTLTGYNSHSSLGTVLPVKLDENYKIVSFTTVTVSKAVKGKYADMTKTFDFTVCFYSDAQGTIPLETGGKYTFSLKSGQDIVIPNVPANAYVRIVEDDAGDFYSASFKDSADTSGTKGSDTGVRPMSVQPRSFDFESTAKTIVPMGIAGTGRGYVPLILAAISLISVIIAIDLMRRKVYI